MAETSIVSFRLDADLKEKAENILAELGISPSRVVQMFYRQILLANGLPFSVRLPRAKPAAVGGMSREELDAELAKGVESLKSGRCFTADEVDAILAREFGL